MSVFAAAGLPACAVPRASWVAPTQRCCQPVVQRVAPSFATRRALPTQHDPLRHKRPPAATGSADDSVPTISLSPEEAAIVLGVPIESTFDDIVSAKNAKLAEGADQETVDAAYDALLMWSMKNRLRGNVDSSVRFADVPKYRPPEKKQNPLEKFKLPGGLSIEQVSQDKAVAQAGVFAALATWALIQGITDSPSVAQADVAGLQLALALSASVYFMRENKRLGIGRAAGITGAGLLVGALLGGALQAWLRVDIVPVGSFDAPGVLVSEVAILGVWAACTFLA